MNGQRLNAPSLVDSLRCCALCGAKRKLEQSHIIPQFVYRWANDGSSAGERQVGLVRPLLCGQCEDRFSFFESGFARHVFHPLAANSFRATKYGGWLRKFAASVCWRILEEQAAVALPGHPSEPWLSARESCRAIWRTYLMEKRPDVAGHPLYIRSAGSAVKSIPEEQIPERLPLRTIASEVICDGPACFVSVKLGPVVLIGSIANHGGDFGAGIRINAEGKLKPRDLFGCG